MSDGNKDFNNIQKELKRLTRLLPKALGPDRFPLRRELDKIRQRTKKGQETEKIVQALGRLSKRLDRSMALRRERVRAVPALSFPEQLPITDKKDEIIKAIRRHPVVIISGETGSGKTTQIPKFCLAAGRGIDGKIGCTQPRRIAAVTVAARIAEELGEAPGSDSVGYKIRFQEKTGPDAYIKIMTDGILLAETQSDPRLREYDTLIVDEAHERSLNIDFLLGILKTLLKKRRDLKMVITSATIDTEKFAAAFDGAPVIEVSGRTYPVEVRWEQAQDKGGDDLTHVERAALAVDDILRESNSGDILVFMPTEQDIRDTMEILAGRKLPGTLVLPLFACLTASDQAKVFSARGGRKIIVATNIAETSLTIPGIKYVIDTGLARVSQYNPRTRTTALPVIDISKSSADQRMGRCGRVQNGICVRLFSEDDYNARLRFTRPEILRANLAEVILRMISLKLPNIADFPFLDRPPEKAIKDGLDLLMELGAIDASPGNDRGETPPYVLTKQGGRMAAMPLDPRLSRMLIKAKKEECLPEVAVIVAALSIQDPRERPAEKAAAADRAHSVFNDPLSDFVSLLNIWNRFHEATGTGPGTTARMKRFCSAGFLSFRRMREWRDIYGQIISILKEHRWLPEGASRLPRDLAAHTKTKGEKNFTPLYGAMHRSILSGFLSNIALRKEGNFYQAGKDREAMIFPGSGLFGKSGAWVVAAEMVETSRLYARSVANIDPDWIEPLAGDRCRRVYLDPHWEKNRGQVVATCQVSLYGLILSADRKVAFGPVAPSEACEIFIREALLTGEIRGRFPFVTHNLRLVQGVQEMEDRLRRRDILIGEEDLVAFYTQRLSEVYDEKTLADRIKKAGGDRWLRMHEKDLARYRPSEKEMALYPESITLGGQRFSCTYDFSPGSDRDGVTVKIPAGTAPDVPAETLDWLVPGLYAEKITTLVKGLPKAYRRQLAPVSGAIDTITSEMPVLKGALLPALSRFIHARFGLRIPPGAWSASTLPDHLKMRIAVTDPTGKTIAAGRDPLILKQSGRAVEGRDGFTATKTAHEKTGLRTWDFGDIPDTMQVTDGRNNEWTAFPALVPDRETADCVHLRLFLDRSQAERHHQQGVRILCSLMLSKDLKFLKKNLKISGYLSEKAAYAQGAKALETTVYEKTISTLFEKNIRTRSDFEALLESGSRRLIKTGESILRSVLAVLDAVHDTRATLYELENRFPQNPQMQALTSEIRNDLSALVPPTFAALYDTDRLPHLVRYLQAMAVRARKGTMEFARDRKWRRQVEPFAAELKKLLESLTPETSHGRREAVEAFFWMLEEYKISVFAQEIKTDGPVSAKRLRKKIEEIEALY